ncbi:RHS repeat-associated core domain-containing protein, partial [Streptomyces murinus]|uniref:RHS repeat-associated core domain-containing protein n=1 Tax=Streptomyces murinus TaxID=33900 RepID=UPI0021144F6B
DSTTYTPLRFPGQYYDPETGLHYNYFRHYDPETARYLSPDPLGLAPALNPSAYIQNPALSTDHLGLAPDECPDANKSQWYPDENYDPHAINERLAENADRKAWFQTPQDIHDLVNRLVNDPDYPQRVTGPAGARVSDFYRGGNSRAGARWAGSPIYDNGDPFSQARVMVDDDGNIAYIGRRRDGSHNYDQVIPYPWVKRSIN